MHIISDAYLFDFDVVISTIVWRFPWEIFHILQDYITDTEAIAQLPQSYLTNAEEFG